MVKLMKAFIVSAHWMENMKQKTDMPAVKE